jgi:hypothetical protein
MTQHPCCQFGHTLGGLLGFFRGGVFKRLRSMDAGTVSAVDADAEESVEVMDAPSEAVRDVGGP